MKVRNILIGLLVVLMAFVFISCEDEPEEVVPTPQPGPAPVDDNTIAKLTVTKDISEGVYKNEKFQMQWDLKKAFGEDTKGIEEGSVLSLQFRSSRDIHWIDFRTNKLGVIDKETGDAAALDMRWIYEEGSLDKLDSLELGEDGWYTLTYTFKDTAMKYPENLDYDKYYYTYLGMNFAGYLMKGDVLEIKNASIDGKVLPLTSDMLYTGYTDNSSLEIVTAHDWTIPKTYAVVYALGGEWRGDAGVPVEAVAAGGKATGVPATNGFNASYTLGGEAFDLNTAINSDLILSYTLTPVQWTVTFDTKGGSEMEPKQVTHGTKLLLTNEELPTYPTYEFLGWFLDSDCTQEFDLATETITGSITLYAGWAQNVRHVTIDLDNAEGTDDVSVKNVVDGGTVTASWFATPIKPGSYFAGWYVGEDAFNPATPITADITVKAHWTEPTTAYKLVATKASGGGTDKFIISWVGDTSLDLEKDDILSFQYRSTASFNMFNVRGADKWFYEAAPDGTYLKISEPDEDGWISVTFKFAEKYQKEHIPNAGSAVNYATSNEFRFDFINQTANAILVNDILEVKGIALNGEELALYKVDGSESGYCTAAVANEDIDDIIVPIADWPATVNVTINYDNGGEADPRTGATPVAFGIKASEALTDTTKGSLVFQGWFTDSECTVPFNANCAITEPITIYGKWISAFAVTLHKNNGESDKLLYVGQNVPMAIPGIGYPGYRLDGWYDNSTFEGDPWDFDEDVVADMQLYAKWTPVNNYYTLTAPGEMSRFVLRYKGNGSGLDINPKKGDVLAFKYKSSVALDSIILRDRTQSSSYKFAYYDDLSDFSSAETDANGFYTFTIVFDADVTYPVDGFCLELFIDGIKLQNGNTLDLLGFTFNGEELEISGSSDSKGPYGDPKATVSGPTSL